MRKILIITHGHFASGLLSSLKILIGEQANVQAIDAYVDDSDDTSAIKDFYAGIAEKDQGIVFTDIYGGSVNQKVVALYPQAQKNIFIITGVNLPILLEVILGADPFDKEHLQKMIELSRIQLLDKDAIYEMGKSQSENENDFFVENKS